MNTRFLRVVTATLALWAAVAARGLAQEEAAPPQAPEVTYYQCTIDITNNTTDCTSGVVTITTQSGNQRVARINLAANGYLRVDAFVDACSVSGWWFHLADSPTADGGGGDAGTTQHDAETYAQGYDFAFYSTLTPSTVNLDTIETAKGIASLFGCGRYQWSIYESQVLADNDADPADAPFVEVKSQYGFESAPYAEPDTEDPFGADASFWYVGLNRTVGNATRTGGGVGKVCFVVSDTTAPSPAVLAALCP
ncbi:MAG TPA: hypothetical protein VF017_06110 [Thermoanaerobaculia bacterium]|nr:hypothetical protein [Thermoanaerobaculia bacterium]